MSDSSEQVQKEYDVFMVFTDSDKELAKHVNRGLERKNLRVISQLDDTAFPKGEPIFDNVVKHLDSSSKTLIILTEESYESKWLLLETILSAEKSIKEGKMILRVLVKNLSEEKIGKLKKGLLEKVEIMTFDPNVDWETEMHKYVTKEIKVGDLLPVGCLAHGQIFSHFNGFLQHVLPDFKKPLLEKAETMGLPMDCVSTKYFILLPSSCNINDFLHSGRDECGIEICREATILIANKIHVGKDRDFKLQMYSVSKGNEKYYFVADLPPVLNAIYQLKDKKLADVDLKYQVAKFYFTMNELINHRDNKDFNQSVEVVTYNNDNKAEAIFTEVKKSICLSGNQQPTTQSNETRNVQRSTLRLISQFGERKHDVFISCFDDPQSLEVAKKVETFLQNNGKTVLRERAGEPVMMQLDQANWTIFVISKEFLDDKQKKLECMSVLAACINENALRIIPIVFEDVDANGLPRYMKFITYVSIKESNFMENILQKMNGDPVRMCEKLPCGDVATGLSWAYVNNYVCKTLSKDFKGRIKCFLKKNNIKQGCIAKMFVIVPETCTAEGNIEEAANLRSTNSTLEQLGKIDPVREANGREYFLHVYRHTSTKTGLSVCFICEYATPIHCLYQMAHKFSFAGLGKDDMDKQAKYLVEHTRNILNREAVKKEVGDFSSVVDFIHFDDKIKSLMLAIEDQLALDHQMIYAEDAIPEGDRNYQLPSFVVEHQEMTPD